jgi:GNAT superfamily N-acetyltransferase
MCAKNSSDEAVTAPLSPACASQPAIRPATLADAREIAALLGELDYPSPAGSVHLRLEALLGRDDHRVLVAEGERGLAGVISVCWGICLEQDGRWGQILALVVAAAERGKGIGARLLAHAEDWLRAAQVARIIVTSSKRRTAAHRFYQNRGYRADGQRFVKRSDELGGIPLQMASRGLSAARTSGAPARTRH